MNATDAIKTHYALAFRTIAMNTEGMSHEDSIRQPTPAGNCANWIVGHVAAVQNELTFGELLNFLAFHQCYHAGQVGLARRLAGLEGVIKGPQERAAARA